MSQIDKPFANLGKHLRNVREQSKRSLAEVSGAIEIDEVDLRQIEAGKERPEEEVMLLLISYFDVQDQEALHLWELAQYDTDLSEHLQLDAADDAGTSQTFTTKPMLMMLAMDVRTMYSDGLEINWNQAGVTLNFTQSNTGSGGQTQALPVARVGMSHKQAEAVLRSLQLALLQAKYSGQTKLLPPRTQSR